MTIFAPPIHLGDHKVKTTIVGRHNTDNIRHTNFSRNPKIAEYLKAYDYVKENADISRGVEIPKRTFDNWRYVIWDMFGIDIVNEGRGECTDIIYLMKRT